MARQRPSLALAAFTLFSLFVSSGIASAQSNVVAAEQACATATKNNDNAGAVSACTQALSLAPNNALVALLLCGAHTGVGNFDAAVTSCGRAITLNAKAQAAYANRCDAYLTLGNLPSAISDCTEAATLDPKDPIPHINLANIYIRQLNFAAAITEGDKALALSPNSGLAFVNRGLANAGLGNNDAALADFQAALKIDPNDAGALKGMSLIGHPVAAAPTPAPAPKPAPAPATSAAGNSISICNEFNVSVSAAFAIQSQGHFIAAGWWDVDPGKCAPADFNFEGAGTLYYMADSATEHWGGGTTLYTVDKKFNFADAEQNRNGRNAEQFNSLAFTPSQQASTLALTFHYTANHVTNVNIIATPKR
jgi:tetratricopeptide (TPR) repeat protein